MRYYLKADQNNENTFRNLSHWLETLCNIGSAQAYLLCDREEIISWLQDSDYAGCVKVLQSFREDQGLLELSRGITGDRWWNAGIAHLTTFLHARREPCMAFWNIDADDLYLAVSSQKLREILTEAEAVAKERSIQAFSLDMHFSRYEGMHWSFGLSYIDNAVDWFKVIERHKRAYRLFYRFFEETPNLDWYFTFLRRYSGLSLESFYVENMRYVHCTKDYLMRSLFGGIYYCKNGRFISPIIRSAIGAEQLGDIPIAEGVIRLNTLVTEEETVAQLQAYAGIVKDGEKHAYLLYHKG